MEPFIMVDAFDGNSPGEAWLGSWMRLSSDFMDTLLKVWAPKTAPSGTQKTEGGMDALWQWWQTQMRSMAALQQGLASPETFDSTATILGSFPDLAQRLSQTALNGFTLIEARWSEQLRRAGQSAGGYDFTDLDPDFLNRWTELYTREFQKFLKIPQLGLMRFHQERLNEVLDRYHLFQAAANELLHLLSVPVGKSFQILQDDLAKMAEKGSLPEDSRRIYQMWIRVLEGLYMTLFQSPEYTRAMGKTVSAMNGFLAARQQAMETILKAVPVPTQQELDELYQELYLLKKRVRQLEEERLAGRSDQGR